MQSKHLPPHTSFNKLRDVEDVYEEQGHIFSLNREILGSFDVCGACEAHALLRRIHPAAAAAATTSGVGDAAVHQSLRGGVSAAAAASSSSSIADAPPLGQMDREELYKDVAFSNCPQHFA